MILRKLIQKIIKQTPSFVFCMGKFGFDFNKPWSNRLFWRYFYEFAKRGTSDQVISIIPKGFKNPLFIRRGGTDIVCFEQIFNIKEYSFLLDLEKKPNTILDCGGYIGLSAAYFSSNFPKAKIFVVEPDRENYIFALLNNKNNKNVEILNSAVWSEKTLLEENSRPEGAMTIQFGEAKNKDKSTETVQAYTVKELLKIANFEKLDFLKVDIEGAEKELFSSKDCNEWINNCSIISCELHDNINSKVYKSGCTDALENALKFGNFTKKISGQYTYYVNLN